MWIYGWKEFEMYMNETTSEEEVYVVAFETDIPSRWLIYVLQLL